MLFKIIFNQDLKKHHDDLTFVFKDKEITRVYDSYYYTMSVKNALEDKVSILYKHLESCFRETLIELDKEKEFFIPLGLWDEGVEGLLLKFNGKK